ELAPKLALDFLRSASCWADSRLVGALSITSGPAARSALSHHVRQYPLVLAGTQWACPEHGTHHASRMHCRNPGGPIRKGPPGLKMKAIGRPRSEIPHIAKLIAGIVAGLV